MFVLSVDRCWIVSNSAVKKVLARHFKGEMLDYVGCKIEHDRKNGWMKFTLAVTIQSFEDEFDLRAKRNHFLAPPGEV
jgi:hypothetical protein